jgi:serine/threonine-protein kinase
MAPEQARGLPVDGRTDVYAVGVCMYHAITGRVPFHAPSFNALMFAIAEQTPPPLASLAPEVDRGLVAIVERAMAKDPARRFAGAGEMVAALAPWSAPTTSISVMPPTGIVADPNAPTVAAPTPAFTSARPPAAVTASPGGSHGTAWVVAGSVALIFVVIGIAVTNLLIMRHRAPPPASARADAATSATASASATASSGSGGSVASADPIADAGKLVQRLDGGHAIPIADSGAVTLADADVPPAPTTPPKTGAHSVDVQFLSTTDCCELDMLRSSASAQLGAASACANASPPSDVHPMYDLRVTPAGAVTAVTVLGGIQPGDGPFHACMQGVLRRIAVGPTLPKCPGTVRVGFKVR